MQDQFSRTQMLFGKQAIRLLRTTNIAIFGVGGVGGYVAEVLARSGIGKITLIDPDKVSITNINRQIYALLSTIDKYKVDVAKERIMDINPKCEVNTYKMFYLPKNADKIDLSQYDYVVDCIDTVSAKLEIAQRCFKLGIPQIASMGAANKIDPTAFRIADINDTKIDPLAKVMRKKLRKLDVPRLKVVYSDEEVIKPIEESEETTERHSIPASNAFVPAAAGIIIGGEVVKDIINRSNIHFHDR